MTDLSDLLRGLPVVPVITLDSADPVPHLAESLISGGLPCAEVTMRTPASLDVLRAFAGHSGLLLGAGSVTSAHQVDLVIAAGARFVVSPGFGDDVVTRCRQLHVPVLPGVATPTEIMRALATGIEVLKVFPAGTLGGPAGLRALAAPFPNARFVPTGGVRPADLADYLSFPAVVAVGGSWVVTAELVRAGRFDDIRELARQAVETAKGIRG